MFKVKNWAQLSVVYSLVSLSASAHIWWNILLWMNIILGIKIFSYEFNNMWFQSQSHKKFGLSYFYFFLLWDLKQNFQGFRMNSWLFYRYSYFQTWLRLLMRPFLSALSAVFLLSLYILSLLNFLLKQHKYCVFFLYHHFKCSFKRSDSTDLMLYANAN